MVSSRWVVTSRREKWHTLPFDACDRHAQQAIHYLGRQRWIHFIVARQDGQVVAFQACENIFEIGELGELLGQLIPRRRQDQAQGMIKNRRAELDVMLAKIDR